MVEVPSTNVGLLEFCLSSGRFSMGQLFLARDYSIRHADDIGKEDGDLRCYESVTDARDISRYDAEGNFRPLKTAPNLRTGWLLRLKSIEEMELALEFFYPSAIGLWLSFLKGTLRVTNLRQTLDRQTGMYRITQLLTLPQADELVGKCCDLGVGCLRTILWELEPGVPITKLPHRKLSLEDLPNDRIPLICRELCNLVVASTRPIAKGNLPKKD
jgi:sirohydrochlorin cobaltochelatase